MATSSPLDHPDNIAAWQRDLYSERDLEEQNHMENKNG